jgi:ribosomal protein L22
MSAEQEKGDTPAEPDDAKAPAAKKAAAVKKPAAESKPAAEKEAAAEKRPAAEKKSAAEKEPASSIEPAEKAAAAPRAAKGAAAKAARRRVVAAHARYVRTSARKARMVCGHLRGKSVQEARAILAFTPREVARDWSKLLESAVANAESNHELLEDDLIVREAYADEGPTIKRFRPRAMGRATPIRKRTSHLTITLTPRPEPGTNKRHG